MMADDAVRSGVGQGPVGRDDVGRRERDVFEAGVRHDDDEIAALLGFPDEGRDLFDLPAADAGPAAGGRQVLPFPEVEDRHPRSPDGDGEGRDRLIEGEPGPDRPDAAPAKDIERLPEAREAVVEDVVVGEAGHLERDRGEPGDVPGQPLEDRPALPDGPAGRRQRALAVDDPQIGAAEDRKQVAVDGLGRPGHDRLKGPDGRPVGGDDDRERPRHFINPAISAAWALMTARVEASAS